MKKLALGLVVILLLAALAGCGSQQAGEQPSQEKEQIYKDGVYVVKSSNISHGNYPFIKMVIKDGKISEVDYREYLVDKGEPKTVDNYKYKESPQAQENLEKQLLEKQDPGKLDLDATSGATHSKENFVELAKEVLEKAKNGETHKPVFKDGKYTKKAEEPSHGWLAEMTIWVEEGLIVGADYDEIAVEDSEGEKQVFDKDGNPVEGQTEPVTIKKGDEKSVDNYKYWVSPTAMQQYEEYIVANQGVEGIEGADVVSGATHTKEQIVEWAEELIAQAKK